MSYDIDMASGGDGSLGTFCSLVRYMTDEVLQHGERGPVELTIEHPGEPVTGVLVEQCGAAQFDIERIRKVRA